MLQEKSTGRTESKSCLRTPCGEGSSGGKFREIPVGRVPLERGFQDSLWEAPGERSARKKKQDEAHEPECRHVC